MAAGCLDILVQRLRAMLSAPGSVDLSDDQLLELFAATHDQMAFEILMRRHGRLVHGVCRRLLGPGPDADDAYQAAFLVLARKAQSIRRQTSVASWLYGVAYRVARDLKAKVARRARHERGEGCLKNTAEAKAMTSDPAEQASLRELTAVLDFEVQRLPKRNREALVLCHLEGLSAAEAARHLGCPLPTLKSRLERARELIRGRLVRRGVTLSAASLALFFSDQVARAVVPAKVAHATLAGAVAFAGNATVRTAVTAQALALAKGVLKAMVLTKISLACVGVVMAGMLGWAAAVLPGEGSTTGLAVHEPARGVIAMGQPGAKEQPIKERVDLLGDPLPEGAVARLGTLRLKHNREGATKTIPTFVFGGEDTPLITKVAFAPDGKKFASLGLGDRDLRLWETATGKQVRGPWDASTHDCMAMAFSPDGMLMAACGGGGRGQGGFPTIHISVWDLAGAKLLKTVASTYNQGVKTLAFTNDGKTIVSAGQGTVRWWDIVTGLETRSWKLFEDEKALLGKVQTLNANYVLSPGAKFLGLQPPFKQTAKNKTDGQVAFEQETICFDLASRQTLWRAGLPVPATFAGQSIDSRHFVYSADGKWVAVTWGEDKVELRETATGKVVDTAILESTNFPRNIGALAVSGDGGTVAISPNDAKGILWHPARAPSEKAKGAGKLREFTYRPTGVTGNPLRSLAFSPDNKTLLAGVGNDLQLYDVATLKEVLSSEGHRGKVDYLSFVQGGKQLRSGVVGVNSFSPHPKEVITWDVASWKTLGMVSSQNPQWPNIGELPPEHTVYTGKLGEEKLSIFDYNSGKALGRLESTGKPTTVRFGLFSPGCKFYAVCLQSEKGGPLKGGPLFRLFAIPSCQHLCDLRLKPQPIESNSKLIVFSPDDRLVAFFGESRLIEVSDVATGAARFRLGKQPVGPVKTYRDNIGNLVFSPDSKLLATWTGADDVIRIFDLKTGHECFSLPSHGPLSVRDCLAWSPDGKMLAVGHRTIQLWEVATMKLRREIDGHQGAIRSLAFSPDGRLLASGSADTTVLIWDVWGR